MITIKMIQSIYLEEMKKVASTICKSKWVHQPAQTIALFTSKIKLGLATSDGDVFINSAFLNTDCVELLINTIRHELVHLIVGTHHNHNNKFKRYASHLGVKRSSCFELTTIQQKIGYKYEVKATLETGVVVSLGGAHRKTKCYSEYSPLPHRYDSFNGHKVLSYEFVKL